MSSADPLIKYLGTITLYDSYKKNTLPESTLETSIWILDSASNAWVRAATKFTKLVAVVTQGIVSFSERVDGARFGKEVRRGFDVIVAVRHRHVFPRQHVVKGYRPTSLSAHTCN